MNRPKIAFSMHIIVSDSINGNNPKASKNNGSVYEAIDNEIVSKNMAIPIAMSRIWIKNVSTKKNKLN